MKKIFKSMAIVTVVGAIASGATWSFFSDAETSTGNTFMADSLDLEVDSTAHYNGFVCQDGVWVDESSCETVGDNLVSNGSFEDPDVDNTDHWQIFSGGDIAPWIVEGTPGPGDVEGLEYQENDISLGSTAFDGNQYVELDSFYPVKLSQDISAVSSGKYLISFKYAPRPGHDDNKLKVTFDNSVILDASLSSVDPFVWTSFSQIITGPTVGTVKIIFEETGVDDQLGMFLDNVDIHEMNCPESTVQDLDGVSCDNTWTMTDLGPTNKLFNFGDIKPGDVGENTVSLHISNGDAWGKMVVDVTQDEDGTCVDPEEEAEGSACTDGKGELRENLDFQVWLDSGVTAGFQGKGNDIGEGDNIKQDGEIVLIEPGAVDAGGEEWLITDAILAAYADNGNVLATGITADGHMTSGVTYYFGIGWELPSDTGNEAQTDIFESDITFEIEQYENNPVGFDGA